MQVSLSDSDWRFSLKSQTVCEDYRCTTSEHNRARSRNEAFPSTTVVLQASTLQPGASWSIPTWVLICRAIGDTQKTVTPRSMSLCRASNFGRGSYDCSACVRACACCFLQCQQHGRSMIYPLRELFAAPSRTAASMPSQQQVKSWNPGDEPEDADKDAKEITYQICQSGRKRQGHQSAACRSCEMQTRQRSSELLEVLDAS